MYASLCLALAFLQEHAPEAAEHVEKAAEAHEGPAEILMGHVLDAPITLLGYTFPSKHMVFFVGAALFVILLARLALRSYKQGIPTGVGAGMEALVLFVRDEIAEKNIGHGDGKKYTSLLLSLFFFILTAALLGLLPFSSTSTGNISVTLGLAIIAFLAMQGAGIAKHGLVGHFSHLVPPGMPLWLLPIMIPIEIIAMFSRPFALMIRLFANMLAGHLVITTLLMLIPLMAGVKLFFGIGMIPISLALALFILILEVLVAFIQAYIFTLLTSIFIGMSVHPAH
jgi:F-type H+-transporting ATPase subunit a